MVTTVVRVTRPTAINLPKPMCMVMRRHTETGRDFLVPFDDDLQKLFAVQGHPLHIWLQVKYDALGANKLDVVRPVTGW